MEPSKGRKFVGALALVALSLTARAMADDQEELTGSLRAAEMAFAASVENQDLESFAKHIDEQAIFVTGTVLQGKTAILEAWSGFFGDNAPRMEWHPETVVVRPDGRLGISRGPYTLRVTLADGTESVQEGQFISIWVGTVNPI